MAFDGIALDHVSWKAAAGTVVGYGIVLAVLTVVMFVIPFLLFRFL